MYTPFGLLHLGPSRWRKESEEEKRRRSQEERRPPPKKHVLPPDPKYVAKEKIVSLIQERKIVRREEYLLRSSEICREQNCEQPSEEEIIDHAINKRGIDSLVVYHVIKDWQIPPGEIPSDRRRAGCSCNVKPYLHPISDMRDLTRGIVAVCPKCGKRWRKSWSFSFSQSLLS